MFSNDIGKNGEEMVLEASYEINLLMGLADQGTYSAAPVHQYVCHSLRYPYKHKAETHKDAQVILRTLQCRSHLGDQGARGRLAHGTKIGKLTKANGTKLGKLAHGTKSRPNTPMW